MNNLKNERRKLLQEQANSQEPVYIDGVLVAIPRGLDPEQRKAEIEKYAAIINDPESGFSIDRANRKARRERFDKRRAFLTESLSKAGATADDPNAPKDE